jgi:hypothetical protein
MPARSIDQHFTSRQLLETYRQVKAEEQEKRARDCQVRETAWVHWTFHRPYAWEWWRIGFQKTVGRKIESGADLTSISGYDTLAQEMGTMFPEYADDAERLWDFLLSPYVPMPRKDELMRRAEERLLEHPPQSDEAFDFGANAVQEF